MIETGVSWLQQHHVVVRRELARFRGREVNTAGDGFLIAFDGPGRAIRCAMNISRQLRSLGIEIRAGLHSGECETVGTNLGGIAVHIGSRVAGTANAGEILVSSTPLVPTEKQATAPAGKQFAGHGCCQKSNYVAQI